MERRRQRVGGEAREKEGGIKKEVERGRER